MRCVWRADSVFSLATIGATERDAIALSSGALVLHDYRASHDQDCCCSRSLTFGEDTAWWINSGITTLVTLVLNVTGQELDISKEVQGRRCELDVSEVCPAAASPLTGCITSGRGTDVPARRPASHKAECRSPYIRPSETTRVGIYMCIHV